ncbi:hypothetical protein B484DRAFT_414835 [Ochromonadaceae sp. CCMP2298]|nr:hypothetical protein B484DRAFT_414835 [Ochromonadaceae sp. CCMP2298]
MHRGPNSSPRNPPRPRRVIYVAVALLLVWSIGLVELLRSPRGPITSSVSSSVTSASSKLSQLLAAHPLTTPNDAQTGAHIDAHTDAHTDAQGGLRGTGGVGGVGGVGTGTGAGIATAGSGVAGLGAGAGAVTGTGTGIGGAAAAGVLGGAGGLIGGTGDLDAKDALFSYHVTTRAQYVQGVGGLQYRDVWANVSAGEMEKIIPVGPRYFKLGDLLSSWSPDDTSPLRWAQSPAHPSHDPSKAAGIPGDHTPGGLLGAGGNALPRFDHGNEAQRALALRYRTAELPFVLHNIPALIQTVTPTGEFSLSALQGNLGTKELLVERTVSGNKYMYYSGKGKKGRPGTPDWTPPQENIKMGFADFLTEVKKANGPDKVTPAPLYYYTISAGEGRKTPWLRKALPIFSPRKSLFIDDVGGFKGINCRFGSKGVVAAAHYDGGRNMVAMIRGRKRYMLLPPQECANLELFARGHPSARHSAVDWADPEVLQKYPKLYDARATEPDAILRGPKSPLSPLSPLSVSAEEGEEALERRELWEGLVRVEVARPQCNVQSDYLEMVTQVIKPTWGI